MKKFAIGVISIASLFILFLIYDFMIAVPKFTVENVKIIDAGTFKARESNYISHYEVNENESKRLMENNAGLKQALITFKYEDEPFLKNINNVRGTYATPGNLPQIIVGKKPDMTSVALTNIYSRMHEREIKSHEFSMTVLIDPKNYNDMEILEMLKTVEIKLLGNGLISDTVLATLPLTK